VKTTAENAGIFQYIPSTFEVVVEVRSLTTDEPVTSLKGSCWLRLVSGTELHGFWRHGKR
jgi:hypothetical protein